MKRHAAVLLVFLCAVLVPATRASARSLCASIGLGGATIVFPKVKRLRPGKVVALNGVYVAGAGSAPVAGTAFMRADGTTQLGVLVHSMAPFLANNFTLNLRLDENLDVTGAGIDEDGNYVSDGPATAATVDCDTVTMP